MGQSWTNQLRRIGVLCAINLSLYLNCFAGVDQGEKKVTLNVVEESCVRVFKQIEKQTKMSFFYSTSDIKLPGKVSINVVNAALDEVMGRILEGTNLEWIYTDNVITIRKKKGLAGGGNGTGTVADSNINMITVRGKVTAADGTGIPGATVLVKGTHDGTITDESGEFSIPSVAKNKVLIVRSVGYQEVQVPVQGKTLLIQLMITVNDLDETVIIAYGTTTKRYNTGNVTTVKAEDIANQPVSNPLAALQGRVPGMIITQKTGVPGGAFTVQIRGQNSILNGNDPLYVVNGVPYISQLLPNDNIAGNGGNPLNFINPADIESIDILKDADATAIYGSRGANGVILITTKKGKPGKTTVDLNISQGISKVARMMDLLSTSQYIQMRREAFKNDNVTPNSSNAPDLLIWDTTKYTDWQKELIGNSAGYTNIRGSISGGTPFLQFLLGGNYHRENTVFPGNYSNQTGSINFNFNSSSANQKLQFSFSGSYLANKNKLPRTDLTGQIRFLSPNTPDAFNTDGTLNWANSTWLNGNPFSYLLTQYNGTTSNLLTNLVINYQLLKNLEVKTSLGYTNLQAEETSTKPKSSYDPAWQIPSGNSYFVNNSMRSWIIEPQANYNIKILKGKLGALVGLSFQRNTNKGQYLFANGFSNDALLHNMQAASTITALSITDIIYKYHAIFTRLNYNWDDKYILNITGRRDGSSRFGPGNQFANFGAIGAAWIFSNESFIRKIFPLFSFGKLRISYGTSGNDQIGDYRFYDLYNSTIYSYQEMQGVYPANLYNRELAWEVNKKLEVGLESGFIKNKILLSASYFRNQSSNQLINYTLPSTTGFTSILANLPAVVQNTGWEAILNTENIKTKRWNWTSSFNITFHRNKLVSFPNFENSSYWYQLVMGQPLGVIQAYRYQAVNQMEGVYQFTDNKGNPTYDPKFQSDRTMLINLNPRFYGGFQNNITFKGIELSIFLQFIKQIGPNYLYNYSNVFLPPGSRVNQPAAVMDRWTKSGDNTNIQKFTQTTELAFNGYTYIQQSNQAYSDASFIRLKNISLSYHLPEHFLKKLKLQTGKIFIQGQNVALITFDKYVGYDPETQSVTSLPPLRVIAAGIQVSL